MKPTKDFHQKAIKCLLFFNDHQSENKKIDPDELLESLKDNSFYHAYSAYLDHYKLEDNDNQIKSFCKTFLQALRNKNFLKAASIQPDPEIVVKEHEGVHPVSYMAFSNLETIVHDSNELLKIMNHQDDLPQWVDELLAISKNNVNKALNYVRSEKTSDEHHKHDELTAKAQDRGYLSRFKSFLNKPKTESEIKMHELDSNLRNLYKNYGPGSKSLDQRIQAAKEHIENKRFIAARRELNYFNEALEKMANISLPFITSSLPNVNAGFFDMFKSKKEEAPVKEPSLSSGAYFKVRRGLLELLYSAEQLQNFFKNIFFPALDRSLSENNIKSYSLMLKEFLSEQQSFKEKADLLGREVFVYLDAPSEEVLRSTFKDLNQQPKDLEDYVNLKNFETSSAPIKALKFEDQNLIPPLNMTSIEEYDLPEPYDDMPKPLVSSVPKEWKKEKKRPFSSSFQSIKKTDECPCGSGFPFISCHGQPDANEYEAIIEKIIMDAKNKGIDLSREKAEEKYREGINKAVRDDERRRAEKEQRKLERQKERMEIYQKFEDTWAPRFYQDESA